jgi:transcriptional regulator with PAS, ATPase and Fis domain
MERVRELIRMVAPTTVSVLLLGETGVGKGLVAQTIHESSPRRDHPYLRLNCAALAETLLESELFGHERGAFTGATANKPGLLEAASGGTVLLDEVGDLAPSTQAKLLHVLEHNEVLRVGAVRPRPIDVRFLAATNRDLETLVTEGRFRQDLWFRLNGLTIRLPPLRERPAEIAALSRSFVEEACARMGRPPAPITEATANLLAAHPWPGNVRELRNVLVRAVLFANGGPIKHAHLDFAAATPRPKAPNATLRTEVRALEKQRIVEALARCGNNQVEAARALGISRTTLRLRMKELDLLEAARRK